MFSRGRQALCTNFQRFCLILFGNNKMLALLFVAISGKGHFISRFREFCKHKQRGGWKRPPLYAEWQSTYRAKHTQKYVSKIKQQNTKRPNLTFIATSRRPIQTKPTSTPLLYCTQKIHAYHLPCLSNIKTHKNSSMYYSYSLMKKAAGIATPL